ncbi:MAG TPA: ATP-binding protein [Verrucomicrobiae bacterium]|nr:ATP-binding protein [Verrucomicrobiae bacterium]
MSRFSSLRVRLAGTVFLAMIPACVLLYVTGLPWTGFLIGVMALGAAWHGGERFILRQVRALRVAAQRLARGDLTVRTGLAREKGELGDLAKSFDAMTASFQRRAREREASEEGLVQRSLQQTVLGALGQFALVSSDLPSLLNQVTLLVSQTLAIEYCHVLQTQDDGTLSLISGVGWRPGVPHVLEAEPGGQAAYSLNAGEPVVAANLSEETRFAPSRVLLEQGVVSGIMAAIGGKGRPFGLLGVHATIPRKFTEDEVHFVFSVATLLAMAIERHRTSSELLKLASFAKANPNPAIELTAEGEVSYHNDAALELARSMGHDDPRFILPADVRDIVSACLSGNQSGGRYETQLAGRTLSWAFYPVAGTPVVHAYAEDITARLSLEAQFRQAQKMESIGQLAAGVAHDFNNMLTIIQGHAGMLMTNEALPPALSDSAQAVYFAAERAAGLTRQLLMFSRKNVMQPTRLDLRMTVSNLSKMLERLLGETVRLELSSPDFIPLIQGDVGMVEQVLMNLAVNARDAMPKGGKLLIATSAARIDAAYAATQPDARQGSFVRLQVSDTGAGMDAMTMRRIFEPFFTTKEVGKGTGLGLATVYGIVKQHGGWITVESEVGQGTTFSVFFPAVSEPVAVVATTPPELEAKGSHGQETILVVEDEPVLRDMANLILSDCGYRVLEAGTGVEALSVWERHREDIQLVVTDMVMPEGMSGMELAQKLTCSRPRLKIIFASGYSMDDLDPAFVRQGKATFLQKPYTHLTLSKAVRESLDA